MGNRESDEVNRALTKNLSKPKQVWDSEGVQELRNVCLDQLPLISCFSRKAIMLRESYEIFLLMLSNSEAENRKNSREEKQKRDPLVKIETKCQKGA